MIICSASLLSSHSRKTERAASAIITDRDSSVNLVVRPWVKSENYWPVKFDLTEKIKVTFDKEGISIPYPQRDLHIIDGKIAAATDSKGKKAA